MSSRSKSATGTGGGGGGGQKRNAFAVMMDSARSSNAFGVNRDFVGDDHDGHICGDEPLIRRRQSGLVSSRMRDALIPALYMLSGMACALVLLGASSAGGGRRGGGSLAETTSGDALLRSVGGVLSSSNSPSSPPGPSIVITDDGYAAASGTGAKSPNPSAYPFWIVFAAREGLGEQLFQYASSLGMMLSNTRSKLASERQLRVCSFIHTEDDHPVFHPAEVLEGPLTSPCPGGVPADTCGGQGCPRAHREAGYGIYTPLDLQNGRDGGGTFYGPSSPGALVGRHLRSYRYFSYYEAQVRDHLTLKAELRSSAEAELRGLLGPIGVREGDTVATVGVHLRNGDAHLGEMGINFPPKDYFIKAMRRMQDDSRRKDPNGRTVFIVLGAYQDVDVFRTHLGLNAKESIGLDERSDVVFVYVERNINSHNYQDVSSGGGVGAGRDLALLASCDHVIMTMGSFGWWSGYLSGGTVVYYRNQFDLDHPMQRGKIRIEDYFPPNWVGIEAEDLENDTAAT